MGKKKRYDPDEAVTSALPILIPVAGEAHEGHVLFLDEDEHLPKATVFQPARRFIARPEQTSKRLLALARMLSLASGQKVDYQMLREGFRTLAGEAFGEKLTDALSKQGFRNPKLWSQHWLPVVFNRELKSVRVVMWWPDQGRYRLAFYCPERNAAPFLSLLSSELHACLGCGTIYIPRRQDQQFHDLYCGNRYRKRRERARKALPKPKRSQPKTKEQHL
jgi:hypothetical protein